MLDSIRSFFNRRMTPPEGVDADAAVDDAELEDRLRLHVAATALLLELAWADDEFSDDERLHLEAVLRRHFDLDEETALELMKLAEAERNEAIDLFQFTRLIRERYDVGQRTLLAELMWGLILTDGQIGAHEAYLLRKIGNLLDLRPGYLSAARKRAEGGA